MKNARKFKFKPQFPRLVYEKHDKAFTLVTSDSIWSCQSKIYWD